MEDYQFSALFTEQLLLTTQKLSFPRTFLFAMGALFIGVVMFFPRGLAGLYEDYLSPYLYKGLKYLLTPENEESAKRIPPGKMLYAMLVNKIHEYKGA